jgi:hypothetical protein
MSTMTGIGHTSSGSTRSDSGRDRVLRLRGVTWLVWRQHRAAYWTLLIAGAVVTAALVYQHQEMVTYLEGYGYPDLKEGWEEKFSPAPLSQAASVLSLLPILIGVFLGAPLLAGDLENGTAKLVSTQSVSRVRWLTTKLGVTALVVGASTAAVSTAFTWWWSPVRSSMLALHWSDGDGFDNSGPVLLALTLFTLFGGMAIGMLIRRVLLSMVVTLGFAVAVQVVWAHFWLSLGDVLTATSRDGITDGSDPSVPDGAYIADTFYLTAFGDRIGWGACSEAASEKAAEACLVKQGVIGWSTEYIPMSQMFSMQWLGASILLALTAAIVASIILRGRKRLV